MHLLLALILCTGSLCQVDREICRLETRYVSLIQQVHYLNQDADYLYWKPGMEVDVRALRRRACRKQRTAQRICCRLQKLRAVREAIVREGEKGVSYEPCAG